MSVLYKCPYCNVFFATKIDVKTHAFKKHGKTVGDVEPFDIWKEARKRAHVTAVWKYRCLNAGKCELCGGVAETYAVGLPDGAVLVRCRKCLEVLMWKFKGVRFVEAEPNESLRGVKIRVGDLDKY